MSPANVGDLKPALRVLDSINWDFSSPFSSRSGGFLFDIRKHHWYPATFVPEIPYTLLDVLGRVGTTVGDPFSGIGTTVAQSLALGMRPLASENCLVGAAVCQWLCDALSALASGEMIDEEDDYETFAAPARVDELLAERGVLIDYLRPWFAPETFDQIVRLMWWQANRSTAGRRAVAAIALSASLKAVCAQDRGWGCVADNMLPNAQQISKHRNAYVRFGRNYRLLIRELIDFSAKLPPASTEFLCALDAGSVVRRVDLTSQNPFGEASLDLLLTSPPYPNMTDYATAQRLSYYWMGQRPEHDLSAEIGARRRRSSSTALADYKATMESVFKGMSVAIRPGGVACVVMPAFDSDDDSVRAHVVQETLTSFALNGLVAERIYDRILPQRRRHHSWTHLRRERIHVLRKVQ